MGLSSNVLWHQTKRDPFFYILRHRELLFSYSLEKTFPSKEDDGIAFPMISLSDIPICEMPHNKWTYGDYAIGFSREWSVKNGFSPVWYCEQKSIIYKLLYELVENAAKTKDINSFQKYLFLFSNVKFVQAALKRTNNSYENYRFYDEREYRLVANYEVLEKTKYHSVLLGNGYKKYKEENDNKSLLDIGVKFNLEDIKYLIVKSEQNKKDVKKMLNKEMHYNDIHIFTKDQILEDFIGIEHNKEDSINEVKQVLINEFLSKLEDLHKLQK